MRATPASLPLHFSLSSLDYLSLSFFLSLSLSPYLFPLPPPSPLTRTSFHHPHRPRHGGTYVAMRRIVERYGLPYDELTGEQIVYDVADKFYQVQ